MTNLELLRVETNLDLLREAQTGMSSREQEVFNDILLGALSLCVSTERLRECMQNSVRAMSAYKL